MSRLQCVQAAIEAQIEQMKVAAPKRRVGVVTFSNQVCVFGDGSQPPKVFAGDRLKDRDFIIHESNKLAQSHLNSPIGKSYEALSKEVAQLEESGPTALGPALLAAVTLAAEGKPGSKVIMCTDGLANTGLGSLDELKTDEEHKEAEDFYSGMGVLAKEKGVEVSVITIKGENSKLEYLSALADESGGEIVRVTPEKLTEEFANILANPVIATHVQARVFLHRAMQFRNEEALSAEGSTLLRELGNVTTETEITFEYTLKAAEQLAKLPAVLNVGALKVLPFQTQIQYTALDGKRCVRVISKQQATSEEKEELMDKANLKILSTNARAQLATKALTGEYRQS